LEYFSLSLWERAGVRDEVSKWKEERGFGSSAAKALTLTLSQRERELWIEQLILLLFRF